MSIQRWLSHLTTGRGAISRRFPESTLKRIEAAITASERTHDGQICFAIEASLDGPQLWADVTAREHAIDVFSHLRVWDTEHNNGVLIYLLLADRDVEIVADRGIHARSGEGAWEAICKEMEAHFRAERFEEGALAGIRGVSEQLKQHYPGDGSRGNELPNRPVVL